MKSLKSALIAAACAIASASWADTELLPLSDDTLINANKPSSNFGTSDSIEVHNYGPRHGLVRFDAASVAGQDINNATLTLYLRSIRANGAISVHPITSAWNEATVTWNTQPPAELSPISVVDLNVADSGGPVAIDVTAAVQRWADGSLPDAGFLIVTSDGIKAIFDSKEMPGGTPAALVASTGPPAPKVSRITVLEGGIVLGDPPHNTFWETEVDIDQSLLNTAKSAHMGLYTINNELGRLVINDEVVQLPYVGLTNEYNRWRPELGQTLLSIPLGYLHSGTNTIRIESGEWGGIATNVYDDFEIGDVEIILSLR